MVLLLSYLLASMGLTILIVWPSKGPGFWLREGILRPTLKRLFVSFSGVLDCYICFGFWAGLALGGVWWALYEVAWAWFGCLMVPAVFWLVMPGGRSRLSSTMDQDGPP